MGWGKACLREQIGFVFQTWNGVKFLFSIGRFVNCFGLDNLGEGHVRCGSINVVILTKGVSSSLNGTGSGSVMWGLHVGPNCSMDAHFHPSRIPSRRSILYSAGYLWTLPCNPPLLSLPWQYRLFVGLPPNLPHAPTPSQMYIWFICSAFPCCCFWRFLFIFAF